MILLKKISSHQYYFWIFLFYAVIAAALIAPIASQKYIPSMADFINHLGEIIQAKNALAAKQFPLRIASSWAYPIFQFYSPSTYLFAGLIYWLLTPSNPLLAYQLITWISLVIGGIYLSRSAYWFTRNQPASFLAGVVYMAAPYNILTQFRIGDLNEGVALGILPAVLFYSLLYFTKPSTHKNLLKLAVSYYLLMTTHLVTCVYFSVFMLLLLFLVSIKNPHHFKNSISVLIAYAWGVLLGAWFLVPVIFFQKYLYVSGTYQTTDNLMSFNPYLANLFSLSALITKGSKSAVATLHPALGWPLMIGFGVCFYLICNRIKTSTIRGNYWLPFLVICFAVTFFCAWSPVNFWKWVFPMFRIAQYSWRLLGQVMWLGALLFAFAIVYLFNSKLDKRHVLIGTFLILMSVNAWFVSPNNFFMSLDDFKKNPFLVYNSNAYLINFEQYPNFVSEVNNLSLDINNFSNLDVPIGIPHPLLKIIPLPEIIVEGKIETVEKNLTWNATSNNTKMGGGGIHNGQFTWKIPIAVNSPGNENILHIKFDIYKNGKKLSHWFKNPIEKVTLTGFIPAEQVINFKKAQEGCHSTGKLTDCKIMIPAKTKTLELPYYYYPRLLKVTLNGKNVDYRGIVDGNSLLVGITPIPNIENNISIEFQGIKWANFLSIFAWILWLFYLIFVNRKKSRI